MIAALCEKVKALTNIFEICSISKRKIAIGREFVVNVVGCPRKAPRLFGVGVFEERSALAALCSVTGRNLFKEVFLQVGKGRQTAAGLPELCAREAGCVNVCVQCVERLSVLIPQLQLVTLFAPVVAHDFRSPYLRDGKIPHEKIAAVELGDDRRAEDVLIRAKKADLVHRVGIAFGKIAGGVLFGRKAAPKFPIAAELQTLQDGVLTSWIKLRVGALHGGLPRLFGGGVHAFEILHLKPLFAVFQIVVHGGELARSVFDDRNGRVLRARDLFGLVVRVGVPGRLGCVKCDLFTSFLV